MDLRISGYVLLASLLWLGGEVYNSKVLPQGLRAQEASFLNLKPCMFLEAKSREDGSPRFLIVDYVFKDRALVRDTVTGEKDTLWKEDASRIVNRLAAREGSYAARACPRTSSA